MALSVLSGKCERSRPPPYFQALKCDETRTVQRNDSLTAGPVDLTGVGASTCKVR
jgi:hypothetical protein